LPLRKTCSGKVCLKILCNRFGFEQARQKGSHITLRKQTKTGKVVTVVPMHKELKKPTLRSVLKLAKVSEEDFEQFL
tara:strand:+ start:359 stop:589 length:231 start_codon:yes stop_codon:yes gene_type:complete